jgi:curved DNA-binding protein CbpA
VKFVNEVIARVGASALKMLTPSAVERARLPPEEAALAAMLNDDPRTIEELLRSTSLPAARVHLLVYLLVISKCVETVSGERAAPSMGAMRAVGPPSGQMRVVTPGIPVPLPPPSSQRGIPTAPPSSQRMMAVATPSNPMIPVPPSSQRLPSSFNTPATLPAARPASSQRIPVAAPSGSGEMRRPSPIAGMKMTPITAAAPIGPEDLGAAGIAARAATIESESFFRVLGLPENAGNEAVRAAYIRLAKVWHPDRLPADLAPFCSEVEKIASVINRAHQMLTDPEAREKYNEELAAGIGPQRERKDVMKEIEAALGKGDFATVEREATYLIETELDDTEAMALEAWALARGGEAPEDALRAAITKLDRTVARDSLCERAYYYRGLLNKRVGNLPGAFRDFSRVVQLDPKHIDAQREVRVMEMRARKGSGEHRFIAKKK